MNDTKKDAGQVIECSVDSGIARVWLSRAEQRNALHPALLDELGATLQRLEADPAVRVVVLGGRGKAFCAGADLRWMTKAAAFDRAQNIEDAGCLARLLQTLDTLGKPTIARIHGACYAGATGLVSACDIAVAAEDARFCFSEVRLGLVPATISPYVLRAMGYRAGLRHMLVADVFDAATALRHGLVSEVAPADALDARVDALAAAMRDAGPRALAETKRLLREVTGRTIDDGIARRTVECIADARASDEGVEGVRALLAGEAPRWRGG
jgi:methylglutaconyl-CoA hydratase